MASMFPNHCLVINEVILTSLLLLKIISVLANFLDFIRDLTISLYFYFEGNLDFDTKCNNKAT